MKVAVLGATGMLGSAVVNGLLDAGLQVYPSYRNPSVVIRDGRPVSKMSGAFPFVAGQDSPASVPRVDYIVNCIGVIKPFMSGNPIKSIQVNSLFPHQLANAGKELGMKVIHITTDCVFSGRDGKYTEDSLHDALDDYGKTKSLGEPDNCMVLRTSIIGPEVHKDASLVAWVRSMDGKDIKGFTNHFWNGVTTDQYAAVVQQIIDKDLYEDNLFHVHSDTVNKLELVTMIAERFDLSLNIAPWETPHTVDRTLATKKDLMSNLVIPSLSAQIAAMKDYKEINASV